MGDKSPPKPVQRNRARRAFIVQARPQRPDTQILMARGYKRYEALMIEHNIDAPGMIAAMDLNAYMGRMYWPAALPRPSAEQFLDQVCRNKVSPDAEFVYRMTYALNVTPDVLVHRNDTKPAPAEIVEAAMWRIQRAYYEGTHPGEALFEFVFDEIAKGERATGRKWSINYPDNGTMLDRIEGVYSENMEAHQPLQGERSLHVVPDRSETSPPGRMRERQDRMLVYYADHLLDNVNAGCEPRKAMGYYLAWREDRQTVDFLNAVANAQYLSAHIRQLSRQFMAGVKEPVNRP